MKDHTIEHTYYCRERNVKPMLKAVEGRNCPTCHAWRSGYAAGFDDALEERDGIE